MKDRVLLKVKLPATQTVYEFRVPFDVTVEQGASLMARILAARESAYYQMSGGPDLMFMEGPSVGTLLNPNETFRGLVLSSSVVDGSLLALV